MMNLILNHPLLIYIQKQHHQVQLLILMIIVVYLNVDHKCKMNEKKEETIFLNTIFLFSKGY